MPESPPTPRAGQGPSGGVHLGYRVPQDSGPVSRRVRHIQRVEAAGDEEGTWTVLVAWIVLWKFLEFSGITLIMI